MENRRWILMALGACGVVYAVVTLAYIASSPDLRLRFLLLDESKGNGIEIRSTPGLISLGGVPRPGDVLLRVGDQPTHNFLDYARAIAAVRNAATPPGGVIDPGTDPTAIESVGLPWLVEENQVGKRWVAAEVLPAGGGAPDLVRILVQSPPLLEVVLTFLWVVFQLAIVAVAALAWWHRPFDRSARLFLAMSVAMLGAFVGGYHWHVIVGNLWLSVPLVAFAAALPAATLHFFLEYPRPRFPLSRWPRATVGLLYLPAAGALAGVGLAIGMTWWLTRGGDPAAWTLHVERTLGALRTGIYVYLAIGAAYFALILAALVDSQLTTRSPIEHNQVKWILRAGFVAAVPLSYSLYLACVDRVSFALGPARSLLYLSSVALMLAYAVAILRYKLMLVDQIISKGVWYWVVSSGLTFGVSVAIALGSLLDQFVRVPVSHQQSITTAAVALLGVLLLLWLRDFGQRLIDRRFFREKYQLDRMLQRMNRAVGYLGDTEALAQMMLGSCCEVLRAERAALYLRISADGPFRLVAADHAANQPLEFRPDDAVLAALREEGSLQRVSPGSRDAMSPVQTCLRELRADLIHAMETAQGVDGLVVLGEKKTGGTFSAEDLTYLHALGQITNVALQTARIRRDVARLNTELRHKTERIDEQNRQIAILQAEVTGARRVDEPSQPPATGDGFRRDALRGNSPAILRVLDTARKVAGSESTVLIRGESGTGKELLAQVLHDNSPRRDGPMVRVHCAALSPGLLESELFGHVKGAFTGAHQNRIGRFEAAHGGTLFLDEIGDISLETQIKLLRVLQERKFEPVGGARTVQVDVRLVTATHQDLERLIAQGRFREDLYYRLNVISLTMPPMRERREDVLELALYFLGRSAARISKRITHIDGDALALLERHPWPGNVRELENVIERAVVLAEGDRIAVRDLPPELSGKLRGASRAVESPAVPDRDADAIQSATGAPHENGELVAAGVANGRSSAEAERIALEAALLKCGGNKAQAARLLGLPRSTYFSKLKKYGLD